MKPASRFFYVSGLGHGTLWILKVQDTPRAISQLIDANLSEVSVLPWTNEENTRYAVGPSHFGDGIEIAHGIGFSEGQL